MNREQLRAKKAIIGIGAAKTGSTSLYYLLRQHPDIYMSPIKETNYFAWNINPEEFRADYGRMPHVKKRAENNQKHYPANSATWVTYGLSEEQYIRLFEGAEEHEYVGEVSNSYLFDAEAIQNIKAFYKDVKFFVILRNPVERLLSHYKAMVRDGLVLKPGLIGEVQRDLEYLPREWGKAHLYVDMGYYARQLKAVLSHIDRQDLYIIFHDDMCQSTHKVFDELVDWLGLKPLQEINTEKRNEARMPRWPSLISFMTRTGLRYKLGMCLPEKTRRFVKQYMYTKNDTFHFTEQEIKYIYSFYEHDINELESLLNICLDRWRLK